MIDKSSLATAMFKSELSIAPKTLPKPPDASHTFPEPFSKSFLAGLVREVSYAPWASQTFPKSARNIPKTSQKSFSELKHGFF